MDSLQHSLFFDIETASRYASYGEMSPAMQEQWARKSRNIRPDGPEPLTPESSYPAKAAIYAEFARVVCISVGCFSTNGGRNVFQVKSFADRDEANVLDAFCRSVTKFAERNKKQVHLIGHNVKEFDVPFLARRMLVHGMMLPECLQIQGKKPWDVKHIEDTMDLWRFGDVKNYTSLSLLAALFEIPTPKDDIDGSMVGKVFWEDGDLHRLAAYCKKDVATTARVYLRLKGIKDTGFEVEDRDA